MADEGYDVLTDHQYDGIQEYDNPCPGWWTSIYAGSVVFAIIYFLFFQFSPIAWTAQDSHEAAAAKNAELLFGTIGDLASDEKTMLEYMGKPNWIAFGKTIFTQQCVSCHGANGQGLVGTNLTDDAYKNVKTLADIPKVVADGAANGAMPAWKTRLHPNKIVLVSVYVATLRGQNLPGPRGAEGNVIPPWPPIPESEPAEAQNGDKPAAGD